MNHPLEAWVSVTVHDTLGEQLMQESIVLDRLRSDWNRGQVFSHHIMVPNIPANAGHMKVFLWNMRNVPLEPGAVRIRLYGIVDDLRNPSNLYRPVYP